MQNMETYRHQSYVSTSGRTWNIVLDAPELQGIHAYMCTDIRYMLYRVPESRLNAISPE
jgi:hypothetical protein